MDKNAKRLLDIIRNSGINTDNTEADRLNNMKRPQDQDTNIPDQVRGSQQLQSAPINVNTSNPGSVPLQEPTLQPEASPTGDVGLPGDPDLQMKINALKRLRGGM